MAGHAQFKNIMHRKAIDALEDLDDVQAVFANVEVCDAVLAKLSA
jgi:transcriptional/translational regulatory protein YebC/TACO1